MNTTIQALQGLYIKMGGALTDVYSTIASGAPVGDYTTIPDMIEACTQKAGSGGGGSAELFKVTISDFNFEAVTVGNADKTAAEIAQAINAGKNVVAGVSFGDEILFPYVFADTVDGSETIGFVLSVESIEFLFIIDSDGVSVSKINGLPAVDSDDNGKILKVVNGAWAVAEAT